MFKDGRTPPKNSASYWRMKYRILGLWLSAIFLLLALSPAQAAFTDTTSHWAQKYIDQTVAQGVIRGYSDGTFKPNSPVTQNEAIIMIVRGLGLESQASRETAIPSEFQNPEFIPDWALGYIAVAVKEGVFTNDDLSSFAGYKDTPRWKAAVWLVRAMGLGPSSSPPEFTDISGVPSWALGYITTACDKGLVAGTEPGKFSPNTALTRAQMATLLCRFDEKVRNTLDNFEITGQVTAVSTTGNTISVKAQDATSSRTFSFKSGAAVYDGDRKVQRSSVSQGDQVRVIFDVQGGAQFVEILPYSRTITGILSSKLITPQVTLITVDYTNDDGKEETADLTVEAGVTVEKDEKAATFSNLSINDSVTVTLRSGKVVSIQAESYSRELEGTLKSLTFGEKPMLTIETKTLSKTYPIAKDTVIRRDKTRVGLTSLRVSDKITIEIEGGEIVEIKAEGSSDTVEGTLLSITIAQRPVISIETREGTKEFPVSGDARVRIGSRYASLSDLKAGYRIEASLSYGVITGIDAQAGDLLDETRGTVVYVDTKNECFVLDEGSASDTVVVSLEDVTAIVRFDRIGVGIELVKLGDKVVVVGHREADRFIATAVVVVGSQEK
jgi:hypothetical protein